MMSTILIVLGLILLLQSLLALAGGLRFARYAMRSQAKGQRQFQPKAVILVPCKGIDLDFEENLRPLFHQDYREYEIVFITESEADPAHGILSRMIKQSRRAAWLLVAGEAKNRGQKIHNLCAAIEMLNMIDRRTEVLVFADADARPGRNWLAELVAPLGDKRVGATTGFRWFVPARRSGIPSTLLAVWNAGALSLLGERSRFAWGGSMAIRRENFDKLYILRRWEGAVSDDYMLTGAIHEARQRIKFIPLALVASPLKISWRDLFEFTTRQIRITRVYAAGVWKLGLITHLIYNLTFWGSALRLGYTAWEGQVDSRLAWVLGGIYLLGAVNGWIRATVAAHLIALEQGGKAGSALAQATLNPLISLLYLYNFLASLRSRRIVWRGIDYEMISPRETIVHHRPARPAPGQILTPKELKRQGTQRAQRGL